MRLCIVVLMLTVACGEDPDYLRVDFSKAVPDGRHRSNSDGASDVLRVAVAAMTSPKETFVYYQALLDFLSERLDLRIQLVQRKTYGEINDLFLKGQIDLAFICSGPYAVWQDAYRFEGLAVPVIRGQPFYQSYLIVNIDSPYQRLEDLRGRLFAFTDPESNTGFLVPNYWLKQIGESPNRFFKGITYTFSHDNSILAVAKSLVDAAAVDGHKWEYYRMKNPYYTEKTRVIKKSEHFGSPPLVASASVPDELKRRIRNILLSMHQTDAGTRILKELMVDRFVSPEAQWYRPVRRMFEALQTGPGGDNNDSEDA